MVQYAEKSITITLHITFVFKISDTYTSFQMSFDRQQWNIRWFTKLEMTRSMKKNHVKQLRLHKIVLSDCD